MSEEVQRAARRAPGLPSQVRTAMKQISIISEMGNGVSVAGRREVQIFNPMIGWKETLEVH